MSAPILPKATPVERALEAVAAEVTTVPVPFDKLWNPDACPASHLHILARTYAVEVWSSSWPEETKRAVIKATPEVKRHKGTRYALEVAISALNMGIRVSEWFEYGGAPYRFRLALKLVEQPFTAADVSIIYKTAIAAKNVRSMIDEIELSRGVSGRVYIGAATKSVLRIAHNYDPLTAITFRGPIFIGAACFSRHKMRLQ